MGARNLERKAEQMMDLAFDNPENAKAWCQNCHEMKKHKKGWVFVEKLYSKRGTIRPCNYCKAEDSRWEVWQVPIRFAWEMSHDHGKQHKKQRKDEKHDKKEKEKDKGYQRSISPGPGPWGPQRRVS